MSGSVGVDVCEPETPMGATFSTQPPRKLDPGEGEGEGRGTAGYHRSHSSQFAGEGVAAPRSGLEVALPGPEPGIVRPSSAFCA